MNDTMYKLALSGGGLTVDQEIDQPTALAIVNLVLGGRATPPTSDALQSGPVIDEGAELATRARRPIGGGLSVGEFIAEVSATRNPDKIVAIGVFLEQGGKTDFTTDDVKPMFQQAGEPTPANFSRDWRQAQNAKWIAPVSGNEKNFYVTNTGRAAVEAHFAADVRKQVTQPTGKRSRKKSVGAE